MPMHLKYDLPSAQLHSQQSGPPRTPGACCGLTMSWHTQHAGTRGQGGGCVVRMMCSRLLTHGQERMLRCHVITGVPWECTEDSGVTGYALPF